MPIGTGLALGLGAGLGGLKYMEDKDARDTALHNNKAIIRYSPWTGLKPGSMPSASLIGDLLQGGASGAMLGAMNPAGAPAETGAVAATGAPNLGVASQALPSLSQANQDLYSNIAGGNSAFSNPGSAGALGGASMPADPSSLQNPWGQMKPKNMYSLMNS